MTQRKRRMRATHKARLEHAGFNFFQDEKGKWIVQLPIYATCTRRKIHLPRAYKHLTTAVSSGIREIERVRVRKNAYGDLGEEWETALKRFDAYEPDFKNIW